MKKFASILLGMTLAFGAVSAFGFDDEKKTDKMEKKGKKKGKSKMDEKKMEEKKPAA